MEDYTTKFWVVPDMIRHMVGWVIDQCVDGEKLGGYVTKDIKKTTDYLSAPGTKLWKPMRTVNPIHQILILLHSCILRLSLT